MLPKNFDFGSTLKYTHTHTHTHTHIYIYIHTHIYIYIYTHTHTYIYLAWKAPFEGQNGDIIFEQKARCIQRSRNQKVTEFLLLKVVPPIMNFLNLAKKWLIS